MARVLIVAASMFALLFSFAQAQDQKKEAEKKAPIAPVEKLGEGWDEIDERLIFLMIRLANTETSLEAVEKAIGAGSRKASARISESKRAIGENEKMDRKGGGQMKWSQFYGTTAEKFFYHPTDRNSSYHTVTVLSPQPPQNDNQTGPGVPSRQGLPVHQRPPQFDYIYRANEGAAAKAESEAAGLRGKVEAITARRRKLELEQVALWVEIAFRTAAHFELNRKPVFRFEPVLPADDPDAKLHADIMKTSAEFMRVALAIVDEAPKDQDGTLTRIKPAIGDAREKLDDAWLRLAVDTSDKNTVEGRFFALSKRLNDVSRNLTESYEISIDGDINADEVRKDTFRGQLQDSLISYAQIVLALDEMATQMKDQWNVKPDMDKAYATVSLSSITPVRMSRVQDSGRSINSTPGGDSGQVSLFDGKSLNGWKTAGDSNAWRVENGTIVCSGERSHLFYVGGGSFKNFHFKCDAKCFSGANSGVYFHTQFKDQGFPKLGFECQIDNSTEPGRTGSLFGVSNANNASSPNGQWFTLEIIVNGNRITIKIDGSVVVDYVEPKNQKPANNEFERLIGEGIFALQSNSPKFETHFRNIQVKRLDD